MAQKRPHPAALGLHVPAYSLTCVACNYAAQSYDAYIGHLISCPDLPQVRCSHCSTTFRDTKQLALHLGEPPLLSFLFDPPTTSSTTAVTTPAATVFTTTLYLPPHSPLPTYFQHTVTQATGWAEATGREECESAGEKTRPRRLSSAVSLVYSTRSNKHSTRLNRNVRSYTLLQCHWYFKSPLRLYLEATNQLDAASAGSLRHETVFEYTKEK